jgi:magnesium chelatase family protein
VGEAAQILAARSMSVGDDGRLLLKTALEKGLLTARGVDRVRRVGETIAALAGETRVTEDHMAEALGLRVDW